MITIKKSKDNLILRYDSSHPNANWIISELRRGKDIKINKSFHFNKDDLYDKEKYNEIIKNEEDIYDISFKLGSLNGEYYHIESEKISTKNDIYIHKSCKVSRKWFIAARGISIIPKIEKMIKRKLYIGGEEASEKDFIPEKSFEDLLEKFPNTTELNKYAEARIDGVISNYFETKKDYQESYQKYLNKKNHNHRKKPRKSIL